MSGPEAFRIAAEIFESPSGSIAKAPHHTLLVGWIKGGGGKSEKIDQAVISLFRAPNSYTGEDVIEISCHGSPFVLKEVLQLCVQKGARLAGPGEFTQRAYLNGKMDLLQAEAVAELIRVKSQKGREIAAQHLSGNLSGRIGKIRRKLVDFLAHLEANLDFVEEDIPDLSRKDMEKGLQDCLKELDELLGTSLRGNFIREGIRIALIGRANVGKSSLFNALLAQERAIVTDVPGTTRDILEERLQWNGMSVVLSDTAGIEKTWNEVDKLGVDRARKTQALASIIFFVLDGSQPLSQEDVNLAKDFQGQEVVVVLNKMDKGLQIGRPDVKKSLGFDLCLETSAKNGSGLSELKSNVVRLFKKFVPEVEDGFVLVNLRHLAHLEHAVDRLKNALTALKENKSEEAVAIDAREALEEIGAITGENVSPDILTSIFNRFCIGK